MRYLEIKYFLSCCNYQIIENKNTKLFSDKYKFWSFLYSFSIKFVIDKIFCHRISGMNLNYKILNYTKKKLMSRINKRKKKTIYHRVDAIDLNLIVKKIT